MFKFYCGDCGNNWYVGNPRTCTCPHKEALKREWQGLTNEEIDEIIEDAIDPMDALLQTMDKLKEKNQ